MFYKKCPLCGYSSSSFLPSTAEAKEHQRARDLKIPGDGSRRNVRCPNCDSLDHERLLFLYLLHETELFIPTAAPMRVLYVRPQPRLKAAIERVSRVSLDTCDEHELLEYGSAHEPYDIVLCSHVLERVANETDLFRSLEGILGPDGVVVVQSAVSPALPATFEDAGLETDRQRIRAFGNRGRVRVYGQDFTQRLVSAGFSVNEFRWRAAGRRYGGVSNRYALPAGQVLFVLRQNIKTSLDEKSL